MQDNQGVAYCYDGTFAGFLTCVFESYLYKETPLWFCGPEEDRVSLYATRTVTTHRERARRVFRALGEKISPDARQMVVYGFLTSLPQREKVLWDFISLGLERGRQVMRDLTDRRVAVLREAVRHLTGEAQALKGFVRFSDQGWLLVGEIQPKNRVLPLLKGHFCTRMPGETFALYDRTHKEALFHQPGRRAAILPVEGFQAGTPGEEELQYRRLWRRFYDAIAIEERRNPRTQRTHLPLRYRHLMTEFQADPATELTPTLEGGRAGLPDQ